MGFLLLAQPFSLVSSLRGPAAPEKAGRSLGQFRL
jgi:hypothetical protein